MPHICPVLADVGFHKSWPLSVQGADDHGLQDLFPVESDRWTAVESHICKPGRYGAPVIGYGSGLEKLRLELQLYRILHDSRIYREGADYAEGAGRRNVIGRIGKICPVQHIKQLPPKHQPNALGDGSGLDCSHVSNALIWAAEDVPAQAAEYRPTFGNRILAIDQAPIGNKGRGNKCFGIKELVDTAADAAPATGILEC